MVKAVGYGIHYLDTFASKEPLYHGSLVDWQIFEQENENIPGSRTCCFKLNDQVVHKFLECVLVVGFGMHWVPSSAVRADCRSQRDALNGLHGTEVPAFHFILPASSLVIKLSYLSNTPNYRWLNICRRIKFAWKFAFGSLAILVRQIISIYFLSHTLTFCLIFFFKPSCFAHWLS